MPSVRRPPNHGVTVEQSGTRPASRAPNKASEARAHAYRVCAINLRACPRPSTDLPWLAVVCARFDSLAQPAETALCRGDNGFRGQAALQQREFGTNRKRQAKTDVCAKNPHHARVLFVQHPPKNALAPGVPCGSFVACAGSFGNCGRATEGGIPKSSRVQVVSLTSLAFSGCVRRRDET